jgi:DNA-binding NarL/FixJ family response regulator
VLARLRRLLERPAAPPPRTEDPRLTAREEEVLRLFASGVGQHEIAERLFITPKTVGTHIENVMRKLGVRTRAQLVARAYRDGLADPHDDLTPAHAARRRGGSKIGTKGT